MEEHEDDLMPSSVKEYAVSVDLSVTEKLDCGEGKIEGVFGERDGREDIVVDGVGVDGHEGKGGSDGSLTVCSEKETQGRDVDMEDVGASGGEFWDFSVESRVLASGARSSVDFRDNVVTTITCELNHDVQKSGNGIEAVASTGAVELSIGGPHVVRGEIVVMDSQKESRGLKEEIVERPVGSVQEGADGGQVMDEKTEKEADVLDSPKAPDSLTSTANLGTEEVTEVATEEGLFGKEEALYGVSVGLSLSSEVVNAGPGEGTVHVNIEGLDQQAEINGTRKEESLHPTIDDRKFDVSQGNLDCTIEQQLVNVKPADESLENFDTTSEDLRSSQEMTQHSAGDGVEQIEDKISFHSVLEATNEHHLSEIFGDDSGGINVSAASVAHSEVAAAIDAKVSDIDSMEPISLGGEVLTTVNEYVCASSKNIADIEVDGSTGKAVDESSKTDATACTKADEVTTCTEVRDIPTTTSKVSNSEVQVPSSGGLGNVVEDKGLKVSVVTESSKADVAPCTEPESSNDQAIGGLVQNCKVELPTTGNIGGFAEGQGLKAEAVNMSSQFDPAVSTVQERSNDQIPLGSGNEVSAVHTQVPNFEAEVPTTGEMDGFRVSSEDFVDVNCETVHVDVDERDVPSANPELSFEGHVDRGEDAGMDIDEVLGWKDEIPGIDGFSGSVSCPETNQYFKIGQREEDPEFRKPIVYERRVHIEAPFYDAFDGSYSQVRDENLKVNSLRGNSDEDDRSVQEEEQNVVVHSGDMPTFDGTINEECSTLALVDTVGGENHPLEAHLNEAKDGSVADKETEAVEHSSEAEQSTGVDEAISEPLKRTTSVSLQQSCYFHPRENGEFSVSDLVWGKVRSHPWWPGQICDPADASEKAMKYHKKNRFLVAYFGDRTFAWNDSTVLKPFRAKFSQIDYKHSNSDAFRNAVSCALEEVSRRVELGLACSCVSQDVYERIQYQDVENGGIKQESSKRYGIDKSVGVNSFEPDKLVDYVRLLAQFPYSEDDKLELAIAKAQLSSYGRYKGHRELPEFQFCGELLEGTDDASISGEDRAHGADGKITNNSVSSHGVKKRKHLDSVSNGSMKRHRLHPEKAFIAPAPTPTPTPIPTSKPSFKVGECIQRVASQLTGAPSIPKSSSDKKVGHAAGFTVSMRSLENSGDQASLAEMLSQLHLAAQNPMKGYSFLNSIIPFFSSYRSFNWSKSIRLILSPGITKKRKMLNENNPERFEFDDVNDSYWTDRIIQNHSEEKILQDDQNGGHEFELVPYEPEKPVKPGRRSNKKRFFNSNHETETEEQSELDERRRQNLATEVILKFAEGVYFTSEMNLNKMFRRFGPLMESETEVDRQSGRARVVFKRCSDAEVAHSSAEKFNIFGSINVNYELNYTPLVSYKPLPLPVFQDPENAT